MTEAERFLPVLRVLAAPGGAAEPRYQSAWHVRLMTGMSEHQVSDRLHLLEGKLLVERREVHMRGAGTQLRWRITPQGQQWLGEHEREAGA